MAMTVVTVTDGSGVRLGATELAPHVYLVRGTWDANGEVLGDIPTGLAFLYDAGVSDNVTPSLAPMYDLNVLAAGGASLGNLAITECGVAQTGHWYAIGRY